MNVVALVVAVLALAVSAWSIVYTRRATAAAEALADTARAADLRSRQPQLVVTPQHRDGPVNDQVFYTVRNAGPQDLDSVTIFRPRTSDGITYSVRIPDNNWADDQIELGSLELTQERRFALAIGFNDDRPKFEVKVVCTAGTDKWTLIAPLPLPESPADSVW